ncbi:MAG: succinate dehydrogenase, cytochrome b556 subunit [bacterium]
MLSKVAYFYRRHIGSWAWIIHRLTGIALVGYIIAHIWELHTLAYASPDAFNHKMLVFQSIGWKFMEWSLLGIVMAHAVNGIRIMFVDFFGGARYRVKLNIICGLIFVILMGITIWPMFLSHL